MIRVVIAVPALALRVGLRALINETEQVSVVAEAAALADIDHLPANTDLLIVTPEILAEGELQDLVETAEIPPAVLLLADDGQGVRELAEMPLRAWGVLPSDSSEDELFAAIQALSYGLVTALPEIIEQLAQGIVPAGLEVDSLIEELTNRELETLELLAEGLANKQIALELGISEHTVKFHVSSIYTKLDASNRTEAVRIGARLGLISL